MAFPFPTQDQAPPPPLDVRWLHLGTPYLDLLGSPVTGPAASYASFTAAESEAMEARWLALSDDDRLATRSKNPSLEDITRSKALKEKRDKELLAADRKKGGEGSRRGSAQTIEEADARHEREEEQKLRELEMSTTKVLSPQEMEEAEANEMGVPVAQDGMFEVDVKEMRMVPVFWTHKGNNIPVRRGRWFFDDKRPCPEEMCDELEEGYEQIKPWVESYPDELQAALANGKEAEAKLRFELKESKEAAGGSFVIFQNENVARVISEGISSRLSQTVWTALRVGGSGGTLVYRGFSAAQLGPSAALPDPRSRTTTLASSSSQRSASPSAPPKGASARSSFSRHGPALDDVRHTLRSAQADLADGVQRGIERVSREVDGLQGKDRDRTSSGASARPGMQRAMTRALVEGVDMPNFAADAPAAGKEVTDLFLVIHGIGQHHAATHEGFSFVYAVNVLRKEAMKQAASPAVSSIMRDRSVQFLPIQWRASLKLSRQESQRQEDIDHELDNSFELDDITLKNTIPIVRELTNNILIDIPYFMSHHKKSMIEAVANECNKTYRRWCRRHPSFEKNGRVHIIAHSLGSALIADILSNQATHLPSLSRLPKQVVYGSKDRLIFNTHSLFLVGSPLGLFLHLNQAQLIPRRGRARTRASPPDEALDRAGRFGCLSVDSIYNIFNPADPVAYTLNAAVDQKSARSKQPLAISTVTAGLYASVSETVGRSVGSLSKILFNPFSSASSAASSSGAPKRPEAIRLPSGLELSGPPGAEKLQGSRADRRFSALNPHGTIDFCLQASGSVSQYVDMITAHGDYWANGDFACFVLAETFASKEDLVRTGMGAPLHEGDDS